MRHLLFQSCFHGSVWNVSYVEIFYERDKRCTKRETSFKHVKHQKRNAHRFSVRSLIPFLTPISPRECSEWVAAWVREYYVPESQPQALQVQLSWRMTSSTSVHAHNKALLCYFIISQVNTELIIVCSKLFLTSKYDFMQHFRVEVLFLEKNNRKYPDQVITRSDTIINFTVPLFQFWQPIINL